MCVCVPAERLCVAMRARVCVVLSPCVLEMSLWVRRNGRPFLDSCKYSQACLCPCSDVYMRSAHHKGVSCAFAPLPALRWFVLLPTRRGVR